MRETALTRTGELVPGGIVQYVTSVTLAEAVEHGEQLSKLNRENKAQAVKLVAELVRNLVNFFKTKRALETQDDYYEVAFLIIEAHKMLKVEEIAYAFKLAKLGKLGKVFDRLDGSTVLAFVEEYDRSEERAAYFEKRNSAHKQVPTPEKFEALSFLADNAEKLGLDVKQIGQEKKQAEDSYRRFKQDYIKEKIKQKHHAGSKQED